MKNIICIRLFKVFVSAIVLEIFTCLQIKRIDCIRIGVYSFHEYWLGNNEEDTIDATKDAFFKFLRPRFQSFEHGACRV